MRGRALRTCYRALLRQVREVQRGGLTLSLQAPVSRDEWRKLGGAHAWAKVGLEHRRHIAQQLLPWMAEVRRRVWRLGLGGDSCLGGGCPRRDRAGFMPMTRS